MSIIEGFGAMDFCANLIDIASSHPRTEWDSFIRPKILYTIDVSRGTRDPCYSTADLHQIFDRLM